MFNISLINDIGLVIDCFSVDTEELTVEDIASRNWCLSDGDKIEISKD